VIPSPAPAPDRRSRNSQGPRLFERGKFLDEFEALFTRSLPVASRCIAIEGPWGSGRTALINAAADVAGRAGCLVLRAKGGELEEQTPLAVLGRLVETADAQGREDVAVREQAVALERLMVDSVADRDAAHPDPVRVASLFHRLVLRLRETAPVLVIIDDADRADPDTLAVLQFLVRRLDHQQIWLVVSTRPLHPGVGLRPIDGLLTESDTREFVLGPLQPASVEAILVTCSDEPPAPDLVSACHEATSGSPFLLKALLPSLLRTGVAASSPTAEQMAQIPAPRATQAIRSRLAGLPPETTELLQAGAVLGGSADPPVARQLAGISADASEQATDVAQQAGLLRSGRSLEFTAPLIRWAVYHDIPSARRSALHARAAQLHQRRGADSAVVARHLLATGPAPDPTVARHLVQVGRDLAGAGREDLARACFDRALGGALPPEERAGVLLHLAAAELAEQPASGLDHLRQSLELGGSESGAAVQVGVDLLDRVAGSPILRAETTRLFHTSRSRFGGTPRPLQVELELALTLIADRPTDRAAGVERIRSFVSEADIAEHPVGTLAQIMLEAEDVIAGVSIPDEASLVALERAVRTAPPLDRSPIGTRVRRLALLALLCADRFESVDRYFADAPASDGRDLDPDWRLDNLSALSPLWQGALARAGEAAQRHPQEHGEGSGEPAAPTIGAIDALVEQGRIDDAQHLADRTDPARLDDPLLRSLAGAELGRLLVAQNRPGEGIERFKTAGAELLLAGVCNPALVPWRANAAVALAQMGQWEEAQRLSEENLHLAQQFGVARTLGIALRASAATSPDPEVRTRRLTEACAVLEASPARLEFAHTLVEFGAVLVDRDKSAARDALRRGATLASWCGCDPLVEVAGDLLRAAGARPRRLGAIGLEALTPAELRVAGLAADGMTNQRIADTLYVTLKTVEGHLGKVYRKLEVESRRDLAGILARPGRGHADDNSDRAVPHPVAR